MSKEMERLKEIEARKNELREEIKAGTADEARLKEIREEAEKLADEERGLRDKISLNTMLAPGSTVAPAHEGEESRADQFRRTSRMSIPMFIENRSVLVSSGQLATPTAVAQQIGELPKTVSSIIDDVEIVDATGTGAWRFPYRKTDSTAVEKKEGEAAGGTTGTFGFVEITPSTMGVLDEVSNLISKQTNVAYQASVQNNAYLALRRRAKEELTKKILASELLEKKTVEIGADYLRKVVLGFGSDESVGGGTKLYLCKDDLELLGAVRGTNEKRALFDIEFKDENNGTIKEGGLMVPFCINASLVKGQQLYGQPKTVKMLMWGPYEVTTDDGGDYFKRSMIGIKGEATVGADLAAYHGFQLISQSK